MGSWNLGYARHQVEGELATSIEQYTRGDANDGASPLERREVRSDEWSGEQPRSSCEGEAA